VKKTSPSANSDSVGPNRRERVAGGAVPVDQVGHVDRDHRQQRANGTIKRVGRAQRRSDTATERPQVVVGGVRREPRQHRGRQRDGGDRVRDHHQQERAGVHGVAGRTLLVAGVDGGRRTARGDPHHDRVGDLVDDHEQDGPDPEPQRVPEPGATEVEPRAVPVAGPAQERQQDQQLDHDPEVEPSPSSSS
jgi:hypothetical protein